MLTPYAPGRYTPHFSVREMQASEAAARYNIDNRLPPQMEGNMLRLCGMLETVRARFGPLRVTSGYRAPRLNALIAGSPTSAHMDGRAADFQPLDPDLSLRDVALWIASSKLEVDQLIYEFGAWLHLGIARHGETPRRQALMIFKGGRYEPFNPKDLRVTE